MINHARTLLLNQEAADPLDAFEEFIEPTFTPLKLMGGVYHAYAYVFDAMSSRKLKNIRARQLLTILHASDEYERYILELDKRITYLPFLPLSTYVPLDLTSLLELPALLHDCNIQVPRFSSLCSSPLFADRIAGFILSFICRLEDLHHEVEGHKVLGLDRSILSQ